MVGKNIKRIREKQNLTQEEMAHRLNVTRQAVSNWETGKTSPDIETLHQISQVLDVPVEELIYGAKRESTTVINNQTIQNVTKGLSFGSALAMVLSYVTWKSVGWAILHGALNWFYVLYFVIRYGLHQ